MGPSPRQAVLTAPTLALLMLAVTGFHGLTMTPAWPSLLGWLEASAGLGQAVAFSAGMLALMARMASKPDATNRLTPS